MKLMKKALLLFVVFTVTAIASQVLLANSATESVSIGSTHGTEVGEVDGSEAGLSDKDRGFKADWRRNFPTTKNLIKKYGLEKNGSDYQNQFVASYKVAYQRAYTVAYLGEADTNKKKDAKTRSAEIGEAQGAAMAGEDLQRKSKSDWELAYSRFIKRGPLKKQFNLEVESDEFIKTFEIHFKEGFKKGYTENFTDKVLGHTQANINQVLIGRRGGELVHSTDNISVVSGSVGAENTSDFVVDFPENAVLQDTYMKVHMRESYELMKSIDFLTLTLPYEVSIKSDTNFVKLYRPITVSFNYNGNSRGGIYKWDGYKWLYQYTKYEDNKAVIQIDPMSYKGGTYALMYDEKFTNPRDVWSNRMNKEIITAYKRRYVPQALYFNPNAKMTYLEYAELVYNAYRYKTLYTEKPRYIANASEIAGYEDQVQYAISMGFLPLGSDNRFDAYANITYDQLQILLKNQLGHDYDFKMVSDKMLTKKFYRSDFSTGKGIYPTKAEVIFTVIETTH